MEWQTTIPPTVEPVTYGEVRDHLRLDDDSERNYILTLITTAREYAEQYLSTSLAPQTIKATFYAAESGYIELPRGPVTAITSLVRNDGATPVTVDATTYEIRRLGTQDYVWSNGSIATPFSVTYTAGSVNIPARIKHAILLHVGHLYRHREATSDKQQHAVAHGLDAIYSMARRGRMVG